MAYGQPHRIDKRFGINFPRNDNLAALSIRPSVRRHFM